MKIKDQPPRVLVTRLKNNISEHWSQDWSQPPRIEANLPDHKIEDQSPRALVTRLKANLRRLKPTS